MKTKKIIKPKESEKRLKKALTNYENLIKEIAPFIRKRPLSQESTAGKWRESSSLYSMSISES